MKMMNVQRQGAEQAQGGSDCGIFAIAFATALVNGIQPAQLNFHQDAMRKHLYNCLEKGELTMFPLGKKTRRVKPITSVDFIELYCTCRMPQLPGEMVECSDCKDWYHVGCVSVSQKALDNTATPWFCSLYVSIIDYTDLCTVYFIILDIPFADAQLAPFIAKRRRRWSPEEERILREELDITPSTSVPPRTFCHRVLLKHPDTFGGRTKAEIQDKYRRIIKKLNS